MNLLAADGVWGVVIIAFAEVSVDISTLPEGYHRTIYWYSSFEQAKAFAEQQARAELGRRVLIFDAVAANMFAVSVTMEPVNAPIAEPVLEVVKKRRGRKLALAD